MGRIIPVVVRFLDREASRARGRPEQAGAVERLPYSSPLSGAEVPVLVSLPPCLKAEGALYPVVYLLHGKPMDETQWQALGITAPAHARIASGEWLPFLMVMPCQPESLFSETDGRPGSREDKLISALVPFIDHRFPTDRTASGQAVAGISREGIWALEIGPRHPETLDGLESLSPALAVRRPKVVYDPFHFIDQGGAWPSRVPLAAGGGDWARAPTRPLSLAMVGVIFLTRSRSTLGSIRRTCAGRRWNPCVSSCPVAGEFARMFNTPAALPRPMP